MLGIAITVEPLDVSDGGEPSRLVFAREPVVFGRARTCDACLPDARVSTAHLELRREGRDWFGVDLASTNGTTLNDRRLPPGLPRLLRTGDLLVVGPFRLRVELDVPVDGGTATATALVGGDLVRRILGRMLAEPAVPRLVVVAGLEVGRGFTFEAPGSTALIGRAEHCEVRLSDSLASREHARVRRDIAGLVLEDLGSLNETRVNQAPVTGERRLFDRDEIRIGATRIVVSDPTLALLDALEPLPDEAWQVHGSALVRAAQAERQEEPRARAAEASAGAERPGAPPQRVERPVRKRISWPTIVAFAAAALAGFAAWLLYTLLSAT
jgi:pSer/pThr/pTyr-binding forkhead associated (FHA) protein